MSFCINPWCFERQNPDELEFCQSCNNSLTINERYKIIRPLRKLDKDHYSEIFEIDNLGKTKVLKVLNCDRERLVKLFKQEAKVLQELQDSELPNVDTCFTFSLADSSKKLYCLVMDKIPGQNLKQWLEQNQVLSEQLAINWLYQLSQCLQRLHQKEILHRDIKPSNIMLRPDGKLILIDFGTARYMSKTYVEKLEEGELTRIYTSGYTAPEQIAGQAVYRSDFFALGRTFVHLLTGIHPDRLVTDPQTKKIIWRSRARQISLELVNLLDELMSPLAPERLEQLPSIIAEVWLNKEVLSEELPRGLRKHPAPKVTKVNPPDSFKYSYVNYVNFLRPLAWSMIIALVIMGIRSCGLLQPLELNAFDRLMALRPVEELESRLVIVTINEQDIQYQNQRGMNSRGSLSDAAFIKLLTKLKQNQARTIGIDIYRDFPVSRKYPALKKYLESSQNLFAPCKISSPRDGDLDGVAPPPEIPPARIGFSDFVADEHEVIRRHLLNMTPAEVSACAPQFSLSLQLAQHYLSQQGIKPRVTPDGELQIGEMLLEPLATKTSGYQNFDAAGYQILLNYRSLASPLDIAQTVSLKNILDDSLTIDLTDLLRDKIVLIGVIAPSSTDSWGTPFSRNANNQQREIPGVYVQAHAISQIISAAIDQRGLIWWWSAWMEFAWLWLWTAVGFLLVSLFARPVYLGLATTIICIVLFGVCFGIFIEGGWIPMVPCALGLMLGEVLWLRLKGSSA